MLSGIGVVGGRREGQVEGEFEAELSRVGNDAVEQRTCTLQTRIGVDFDEPGLEVLVNHEIQSKDLEGRQAVPLAQQMVGGFDGISSYTFELG